MRRPFQQVDVFASVPYGGNPVAVVLDGDGLSSAQMQRFASWTNLSETTFVLAPSDPGADYRVRIFTPAQELPFAGHPTLGTCHAWLSAGRRARDGAGEAIVQQCEAGLVELRRTPDGLAFAAPPLLRSGPVAEGTVRELAQQLAIDRAAIVDAQWADNGPGWVALLLRDADAVLALRPAAGASWRHRFVGVAGPCAAGAAEAFEVRAFFPQGDAIAEDPVTGSLNASLAQWLLGSGRASAPYVARQGTALGRRGRVHVTQDAGGAIWIGGGTVTCIRGEVELS